MYTIYTFGAHKKINWNNTASSTSLSQQHTHTHSHCEKIEYLRVVGLGVVCRTVADNLWAKVRCETRGGAHKRNELDFDVTPSDSLVCSGGDSRQADWGWCDGGIDS